MGMTKIHNILTSGHIRLFSKDWRESWWKYIANILFMIVEVLVSHGQLQLVIKTPINCGNHSSNSVYGCVTGRMDNTFSAPSACMVRTHEQVRH